MKHDITEEIERNRETLRPDWARLRRGETPKSLGEKHPEQFKSYPKKDRLELVNEFPNIEQKTLTEVIASRRSLRKYKDISLTYEELSYLLFETSKVTKYQKNAVFRTIPTGGATNAMETYLYINNVEGAPRGLYHYVQHEHCLTLLNDHDIKKQVDLALNKQLRDAPVVFIFTAVPERSEYKYAFAAHKMIAMEAGHAGQNLHLASEVIDCGAVMIAAYNQTEIDELLALDTAHEFVIYMATLGKK